MPRRLSFLDEKAVKEGSHASEMFAADKLGKRAAVIHR